MLDQSSKKSVVRRLFLKSQADHVIDDVTRHVYSFQRTCSLRLSVVVCRHFFALGWLRLDMVGRGRALVCLPVMW